MIDDWGLFNGMVSVTTSVWGCWVLAAGCLLWVVVGVTGFCLSAPRLGRRLDRPLVGEVIRLGRHGCTSGSGFSCTPVSFRSTVSDCSGILRVMNRVYNSVVTPGTRGISRRNPMYTGGHMACTGNATTGLRTYHGTKLVNVTVPHHFNKLGFPVAPCVVTTSVMDHDSTNFRGL